MLAESPKSASLRIIDSFRNMLAIFKLFGDKIESSK